MFFGGSDDDDGSGFSVGMPSQGSGSKLGSLFGGAPQGGNESLKYQPQKQPTKAKEPPKAATPDAPALMFATACHAFKYVDGQYAPQGKLGAAVLGNLKNKDYKILLYAAQKKPVTNAKIHQSFSFNVQKNNYATFYDDQSQNWSICFDNEGQLAEFSKWVCLSKYNVAPGNLITQDMNFVDGQEVQKGDTVEMKYTGWLHAGNAFGKVFDSNKNTEKLFKFKVGKGKVIKGWDSGVIGMKKGLKRLLVIPPELAYGSKAVGDRVPPNATLIFEVELTRVKYANPDPDSVSLVSVDGASNKDRSKSNVDESATPVKEKVEQDSGDESNENITRRTKSISEQLSKTPDTKSKLLERMSKMGQAMIPSPSKQSSQEDEEVQSTEDHSTTQPKPIARNNSDDSQTSFKPESPRPSLKPKPADVHPQRPISEQHGQAPPQFYPHQPNMYPNQMLYHNPTMPPTQEQQMYLHQHSPQQQLALYQSPQNIQSALFGLPPNLQQNVQQASPAAGNTSGASSTEINLMMTEGKLHHSEVKSDLSRLMEKVDSLQTKIVVLEGNSKQIALQQGPEMEASIIMQNITRILKENAKLNTECTEKGKRIEKLNESMTDLLTKNQSFFEKSNQLLASQSDSMQSNAAQAMAKVSNLEKSNIQLDADLSTARTQLLHAQKKEESFEIKTADLTIKIENLQKELKAMNEKADSASSSTNENESVIDDLRQQIKTSKKDQKQLKLKLDQIEEECSEAKLEKQSMSKSLNDIKKKRKNDKTKYDEELEEVKSQHEDELRSIKQRYSKSASGEAEKISKLEEELNQKFEEKMKTKVQSLQEDHSEKLEEIRKEKTTFEDKLNASKVKLERLQEELSNDYESRLEKEQEESKKRHESQLDEVNRETKQLKEALQTLENRIKEDAPSDDTELEGLRSKLALSATRNENLEERCRSLNQQHEAIEETLRNTNQLVDTLRTDRDAAYDRGLEEGRTTVKTISQASYDKGFNDGKASVNVGSTEIAESSSAEQIAVEVKKVMNNVFFQIKGKFEPADEYSGTDVVKTILNVIRDVTLKMTRDEEGDNDDSESELSEDESEDEEEDDDDDDEREKEIEKAEKTEAIEEAQPKEENASPPPPHPSEEGGDKQLPDPGLDVTGKASFDEVDVEVKVTSIGNDGNGVTGEFDEQESKEDVVDAKPTDDMSEKSADSPSTTQDHVSPLDDAATSDDDDDDDDDNVSFTSATSEPLNDRVEPTEENNDNETSPSVSVEEEPPVSATPFADQNETTESQDDKTALGIDSSIFGTEEESGEPYPPSEPLRVEETKSEDESALFFGTTATSTTTSTEINEEEKENTATLEKGDSSIKAVEKGDSSTKVVEKEANKSSASIFDDDSDEDDFFKPKDKEAKSGTSAFNRSPPPLFEDDDDDTNWI